MTEIIQVDSRNVGRVIGSRGSKIRELQDESSAHIQVAREAGENGQTDVTISGTPEQISKAKELIEQCLNRDNRSGFGGGGQRERRPFNNDRGSDRDGFSNRSSGFGGGQRERKPYDQGSDRDSWRNDTRSNDYDNGQEARNDSWGGRQQGGNRWGEQDDRNSGGRGFGSSNDFRQDRDYDRRGARSDRGRGGFSRGGGDRPEGGNKDDIYVLNNEVGRLIGSGGCKIRELQDDSSCRIKVSRDGCNGTNLVELFGTDEQIEEAKKLISKTVEIVAQDGSRFDNF